MTQEMFTYLITYQALRCLLRQAATTGGIDPDRLSLTESRVIKC